MKWAVLFVALCCSACGDDGGGNPVDACVSCGVPDGRVDASTGSCPAGEVFFTGELLDWDWSLANAIGVNAARFTVQGMPARTATTAPNGRFELCILPGRVLIDVDAPADYVDAVVVVDGDELGGMVSLRTFTATRAGTFYTDRGVGPYDAGLPHILVNQVVDRVDLSLDRISGPVQAGNDDDGDGEMTWTQGYAGRLVLFPNVSNVSPATLTGDTTAHVVPLTAGKLAMVVTTTVP